MFQNLRGPFPKKEGEKVNPRELKNKLAASLDAAVPTARAYCDDIGAHAELGWFEFRTAEALKNQLEALGLTVETGLGRTGLKARLKGGRPGPSVAILCELDGVPCRDWPGADPETGASHSCGHNLQQTMMLLAAAGFAKSGVMSHLSGDLVFLAVPAEEFIEINRRRELKQEGAITFLGGKAELVKAGVFDDVDLVMMVHAGAHLPEPGFRVHGSSLGFRAFSLRMEGKAAHAAAAPHEGINALSAAVAGINAVNALRETFRDEDCVRVHYVITKGGDSVNSVPHDVRLEGYVRALTVPAINDAFAKVRRAFERGAESVGATCHFAGLPGYLPLACSSELNALFGENAKTLVPPANVQMNTFFPASTDLGDLTQLMPAIQPEAGGTAGALHSPEFRVTDWNAAVVAPAKAMAFTAIDLLEGDGSRAKDLLARFTPVLTKEAYLALLEESFTS